MKYGLLVLAIVVGALYVISSASPGMSAYAQQSASTPVRSPTPESSNYKGINTRLPADDLAAGRRRFEAGAHTAWHVHPGGQLLLVEAGAGVVQRRGEPVRILRQGETDFTPPGVPHWHGAAPDVHSVMAMVHFGGIGPWLEAVPDADYAERTQHLRADNSHARQSLATPATASAPSAQNYFGTTSTQPADDMQITRGRFEAGAYTHWHIHPRGQVVFAERGPVFLQRRGEPLKMLRTGESDFTPPGVEHWHGAGPDAHAQKIVVGFGVPTRWLQPVTDAEYAQTHVSAAQ